MSSNTEFLTTPGDGAVKSNLLCFTAMVMWAFAFPIAEVLLDSWGTIALVAVRQLIAVGALFALWLWVDGWRRICAANWSRGIGVGGLGFGLGSMTFLVGQHLSDAVTPAIAASMMPIIGALLEVSLDRRRMHARLLLGIVLALLGGLLATGTRMNEGNFGWGSLLCLFSVVLFAWGTRATTQGLRSLSFVGQTTITMSGSLIIVSAVYLVLLLIDFPGTAIGAFDSRHTLMLIFTSIASLALAQFLWIRGASGLGILLASLHMNAVPFYVMVVVVLFLGEQWSWWQAAGAGLVAAGVMLAQSGTHNSA